MFLEILLFGYIWILVLAYILERLCRRRRVIDKSTKILITGAANGLGRELARILADRYQCVLILADIMSGQEVSKYCFIILIVKDVEARGSTVHFFKTDLSKKEKIAQFLDDVDRVVGDIDILVNNAAVSFGENFEQLPEALFELTIDVNVKAPIYILRHYLPRFRARNAGHIVTISSVTSKVGGPQNSYYASSKAFIESMHMIIRYELQQSKSNIDTTTILPQAINTGMFKGFSFLLPMLDMERVAQRIHKAIVRRQREVYIQWYWFYFVNILNVFPQWLRDTFVLLTTKNSMKKFEGRKEIRDIFSKRKED